MYRKCHFDAYKNRKWENDSGWRSKRDHFYWMWIECKRSEHRKKNIDSGDECKCKTRSEFVITHFTILMHFCWGFMEMYFFVVRFVPFLFFFYDYIFVTTTTTTANYHSISLGSVDVIFSSCSIQQLFAFHLHLPLVRRSMKSSPIDTKDKNMHFLSVFIPILNIHMPSSLKSLCKLSSTPKSRTFFTHTNKEHKKR